jgi:hypothetical protein
MSFSGRLASHFAKPDLNLAQTKEASKNTRGARQVARYTCPQFEVGLPLENLKGGIMSGLFGGLSSLITSIGSSGILGSIFSGIAGLI